LGFFPEVSCSDELLIQHKTAHIRHAGSIRVYEAVLPISLPCLSWQSSVRQGIRMTPFVQKTWMGKIYNRYV